MDIEKNEYLKIINLLWLFIFFFFYKQIYFISYVIFYKNKYQ
jgi:hypothetical protein